MTLISAEEPLAAEHGGELGVQHLDGDLAAVPQVLGEVDRGHAALAQLALEAIPVGEGGGEAGRGGGHEGDSIWPGGRAGASSGAWRLRPV